jgi:hypothetical protein
MPEITILELGESIVQALTGVQQKLARSADDAGRYLMDEVEMDVPVRLRIGADGQTYVTPAEGDEPAHVLTRIRLKLRPAEQDESVGLPPPAGSDRPMSVIPTLSEDTIKQLIGLHLFTIGDFLRATSTVRGYELLAQLKIDFDLDLTIDQAKLIASPEMSYVLAEDLLRHGINSRAEFARLSKDELQQAISERVIEVLGHEEILRIQASIRQQPDVILGGFDMGKTNRRTTSGRTRV